MARRAKQDKTNAMRELERAGVAFEALSYEVGEDDGHELGLSIAEALGQDPDAAFKTLVTTTPSGGHVVCCIPVACELDLKRAAAAAGEKTLTMMHVSDLEAATGYVRGGVSPVGMRKRYPTLIDETATLYPEISISGGRKGLSLVLDPEALAEFAGAKFADIVRGG